MDDTITTLLRGVAKGNISIADARTALESASLTEEQMQKAIDHGVFNPAEPGSIISATSSPIGRITSGTVLLRMGIVLELLLVFFINLWTAPRLGPTTIIIPFSHDINDYHVDGNDLPQIRPT